MPRISVIVPVYNVAAFLPKCLDSLAAQTDDDMEFILIDDGSTDQSLEICRSYAAKDARFVVLHQTNAGVSAARNLGLRHATGDLIGFADSDDWLEPTMFCKLAACMEQEDADVAMCGYYEYLPMPDEPPMCKGTDVVPPCDAQAAIHHILRRTGYFTALWNKIFRRSVIMPDGKPICFDQSLSIGEDETWLLRVLPGVSRAAFVPEPLYHWRSRGESASRRECITPASMSVLSAKQLAISLVRQHAPAQIPLAQSRLLNDCYHLKVIAYRTHDRDALKTIGRAFRPVRKSWLLSDDVPLLRKAKVLTMSMLMLLHVPSRWVDRIFYLRRSHG